MLGWAGMMNKSKDVLSSGVYLQVVERSHFVPTFGQSLFEQVYCHLNKYKLPCANLLQTTNSERLFEGIEQLY